MQETSIQEYLFQRIREKIPPDASLADRISELLHISNDSAYRRIRGETLLVLEEARILCEAFGLSLDQLLNIKDRSISFYSMQVDSSPNSFKKFLQDILENMKSIAAADQKEIIYLSKEVILFHYFLYKPLFAFQYFFWKKSFLQSPELPLRYSENLLTEEIEELGKEILKLYNSIPSIEIWNTECINATISQIEYYRDAGFFRSKKDVDDIYDALRKVLEHLRHQAETGCKFLPGENPSVKKSNFRFFQNRSGLADNTILTIVNGRKTVYLNYESLDYMFTSDESFCNNVHGKIQGIIRRCTILSDGSEKQRNIFFNSLAKKIPEYIRTAL